MSEPWTYEENEEAYARRRAAVGEPFYVGLSVRARNALSWVGLDTKAKVIEALQARRKIRNVGKGTLAEIYRWLQLEPEPLKICPLCKQVIKTQGDAARDPGDVSL
jgi:hypothetical protein